MGISSFPAVKMFDKTDYPVMNTLYANPSSFTTTEILNISGGGGYLKSMNIVNQGDFTNINTVGFKITIDGTVYCWIESTLTGATALSIYGTDMTNTTSDGAPSYRGYTESDSSVWSLKTNLSQNAQPATIQESKQSVGTSYTCNLFGEVLTWKDSILIELTRNTTTAYACDARLTYFTK